MSKMGTSLLTSGKLSFVAKCEVYFDDVDDEYFNRGDQKD